MAHEVQTLAVAVQLGCIACGTDDGGNATTETGDAGVPGGGGVVGTGACSTPPEPAGDTLHVDPGGSDMEAWESIDFAAWNALGFDENGIWGDPLFVASPDDLHLAPESPAVDQGGPDAPAKDFDGVERLQGEGVDIGAYEQ